MRNEPWIGHWSVCAPTAHLAQLDTSLLGEIGASRVPKAALCGDDRAVICGEPFMQCSGGLGFPLVALGPSRQQFASRNLPIPVRCLPGVGGKGPLLWHWRVVFRATGHDAVELHGAKNQA